ncbi:MAG TPA: 16S rRNA (cytosine(967)-C(5))-methyltransferase RsmB [Pyrinomonadaceae bacterium]|jgi:16S rRNA (cytosine967-C5)-methyltransferase|nr:16S rRNA (cytosine(967)-C(5))-methyltransferase RsmB [Pyrinomonadaceae bacterium]
MSRTRVATVSPGRWAAYNILSRVEKDEAFTSILLPLYEADLKAEDRGLCHELTLGVLRTQLFLDKIIEHFTGKKLDKLDLPVQLALRLGLYQMRFMTRIPARAAINESVEIVKQERLVSAASFVNAVLRRAAKEASFDPTESITDELEKLSIAASHPPWLIRKWVSEFGFEETKNLTRANNQIPQTSFRLSRPNDETPLKELEASGAEFAGSKLVPNCFIATKPNKTLYEFAEQGKIVLQDEASQLVAHLAQLRKGESFLDVCAAPGNKTTQIINEAQERGALAAEVFYAAGDLHPRRIETLRRNLERAQIENVKVFEYDAVQSLPFEAETFDCILVDAPCSGTGTIRHNPEIRWSLKTEDFGELAQKQKRILTNAAKALKKGGRIIYSTCSLEKEEDENIIEDFLRKHTEFKIVIPDIADELKTEEGYLRTFPHRNNTDGFFAAVLRKD